MLARNVLIFHAAALGDFVLTWPLGLALGRLYPQSRIIYVTHRQKGELAEKVLRLDSADIESGWHHLFGDTSALPAACRKMLEDSHLICTFLAEAGDKWTHSVSTIAPHAPIVPIDFRTQTAAVHPSQRLLQSLQSAPAIQTAVRQILASIAASGIRVSRRPQDRLIVIHPGSGSREKCWPVDSYLELIQHLQRRGLNCRIVLGEVERDRWPADVIRRFESAAPVAHPTTYLDLLNELSAAAAFIGNDSGPAHLAGIIGLPTLVLFGPTDPALWKPLGPRVTTLGAQPLESLLPAQVAETLTKQLAG